MAGLFFCLASAEGAGLLFCPATIQPHTSVYSAFCAIHAVYTAHAVKQRTGFYRRIPCYLPCFAVAVWRCIRLYRTVYTTLERITAPQHLQRVPDTTATPGRCTAQHSRPIIIRYIRGAAVCPCYGSVPDSVAYHRPCQPGGVSSYRVRIAGKCCTRRTC